MIALSPGVAQGCFELLELVAREPMALSKVGVYFPQVSGIATSVILDTALRLQWLRADIDGNASLTTRGAVLLGTTPYHARLREALIDYVGTERPPWIQNAIYGRARVLAFAQSEIRQVFIEAELGRATDAQTVSFWDQLAALARGQRDDLLLSIGREGERLSLVHEQQRTGRAPRWVAIDNNADGYDILSTVAVADSRSLSIEVKASTRGLNGSFHLTRNEWDRAIEAERHQFHLWNLKPGKLPELACIGVADLEPHIPADRSDGAWTTAELPFNAFTNLFAAG